MMYDLWMFGVALFNVASFTVSILAFFGGVAAFGMEVTENKNKIIATFWLVGIVTLIIFLMTLDQLREY